MDSDEIEKMRKGNRGFQSVESREKIKKSWEIRRLKGLDNSREHKKKLLENSINKK